ncbi:MFS transporter [Pseudomonas sp. LS2P72]
MQLHPLRHTLKGFLLPVVLLGLMLREPGRGYLDQLHTKSAQASLMGTIRYIRSHEALSHIMKGATLYSFWGWGIVWWLPAYLSRAYGLSTGAAGQVMGPIHAIGGTSLMFVTIALMAWLRTRSASWQALYVGGVAVLATIPCVLLFTFSTDGNYLIFLWMFVPSIYVYLGPTTALIQNYLPPEMRAKGSAIYMFNSNISCLAAAPLIIGAGSDMLQTLGADSLQSLRIMLAGIAFFGLWSAFHYWSAAQIIRARDTSNT